MRGRSVLVCAVVALLLGVFAGSAGDVLADVRDGRDLSGAQAVATFSPDPVDFGDVIVGETKHLTVTFTYIGTGAVNFNRVSGPYRDSPNDNGLDTLDAASCKGPKSTGSFCTMDLTFTALTLGPVSGTLTYYDDFVSGQTASVSLRGNGVSAAPASTLNVATAQGPYRGAVDLSAMLAGCTGSVADRAVSLTITTAAGSRTVAATTDASGVATAAAVPLTIVTGGAAAAIPAGEYLPSAGWGVSAAFAGGDGCAAASGSAALTVERRIPTLTFAAPAATTYGAAPFALTVGSSTADDPTAPPLQLGYTADICTGPVTPPASVTILHAGDCTLTLSQPAGDNPNYAAATPIVHTVTIGRATPSLAWAVPSAITYGTPLSGMQLSASASFGGSNVAGSFGYTPGSGSVLTAGDHPLAVTFTPDNAADFTTAQTSVSLTVRRATPVVTWATPDPIMYGTTLGVAQLGASANVAGSFVYSPVAGALLGAGPHDLTVLFTPTDSDNYTTAGGATILTVQGAPLTVTAKAATRPYGADDPSFAADYDGFVNGEGAGVLSGTLTCTANATRLSPVGNSYRITCTGLAATNYTFDYRPGPLTITQASSALTLRDAEISYGAATLEVTATLTAPGPLAASAATFAIMRDAQTLQSVTAAGIVDTTVRGALPLIGLAAGDYDLIIRYAGDANVAPSEGRARLRITRATQAITFVPPTELPLSGGAVSLVASAGSGLTVTLTVASDAPCTVVGTLLTPLRGGACVVTATQAGNANYQAAQDVSRTIQITAPPPTSTTTATVTATATGTPIPPSPTITPVTTVTATPPINTPVSGGTPVPSGTPTPAQYTLTLTANAGGTVDASAPGPRYPVGSRLTLRATPDADALFIGWTVDGIEQGWSPTLVVTMRADRRVEARFAPRPAFGDTGADSRVTDPIAQLAARGIIKGYGDGRFGPADPILRAQMAALIVRALGWDGATGGAAPFEDRDGVDTELWRAVGLLATRGIARGYGDGTYHPRDPVLHIQAVSFVTRALVAAGSWQLQPDDPRLFPDVAATSGHRIDLVTYQHYVGAIPGLTAGAAWTGPDGWEGPATRAWLAELLWRALDALGRGEREV